MNTAIIPVDSQDTYESLKQKILQDAAPRILLTLPDITFPSSIRQKRQEKQRKPKRVIWHNYERIDFILLKRLCTSIGASMGFVTRDERWKILANELGIPVFTDVIEAGEIEWGEVVNESKTPRNAKTKSEFTAERARIPRSHSYMIAPTWLRWVSSIIGFTLLLCIAWILIPSAKIELTLQEENQSVDIDVTANPQVKAVQLSGAVPTEVLTITVEADGEIQSSDTLILADQAAVGSVQLTNLTDREMTVPAGTRVLTVSEAPVVFLTIQTITIQPKEEGVEVIVEAELPGSSGNVVAGSIQAFEDQMGLSLLVTNPEPTSGGTDWSGPAPSESDAKILREEILARLKKKAVEQFEEIIPEGQVLIDGTLEFVEIVEETRTPLSGEPGEVLYMKISADYSVWVVAEADLETLGSSVLDASLEDGMSPLPGTLQIQTISEPSIDSDGAVWQIKASRKVKPDTAGIDTAEFAGKKVDDVIGYLSQTLKLKTEPSITINPGWWGRMPLLTSRIELVTR